jgi:hypothetical protein
MDPSIRNGQTGVKDLSTDFTLCEGGILCVIFSYSVFILVILPKSLEPLDC